MGLKGGETLRLHYMRHTEEAERSRRRQNEREISDEDGRGKDNDKEEGKYIDQCKGQESENRSHSSAETQKGNAAN